MQKVGIPIAVLFMWNGVVCDTPLCVAHARFAYCSASHLGGEWNPVTHIHVHACSWDPCVHASSGSGARLSYLSDHKDGSVTT